MATQASESSQALTEVETSDRDESPEARHIRDNGLAAAPHLRERFANGEARPTHGRNSTRQQPEGNVSRDVSRAMVNLLKEYIGRGASHARAFVHEDLVVVVLHGTMTKAERTLADEGEEDLVRGVRQALQGKFREDANGTVERLTGQHVAVFLSDHNVDEDVVIQAFVLEPRSTSG
jgi:uncharacterized protein YbcI